MAMAAVALPGHENVPGTVSDHAKSRWSLRNCQTRVKGLDDKNSGRCLSLRIHTGKKLGESGEKSPLPEPFDCLLGQSLAVMAR